MAMASPVGSGAILEAGHQSVALTSAFGQIVTVNSDTTLTAATGPELISPMTFAGAGAFWVKVDGIGGRAEFRCKYHVSTDMTTPPIIYVYGATVPAGTALPAPQFATDGTIPFERLDALSGVAGITLTRVAATDQKSTANRYTPWYTYVHPTTDVTGDLNGCNWMLVLCSQASVGGTGVVEAKLIN